MNLLKKIFEKSGEIYPFDLPEKEETEKRKKKTKQGVSNAKTIS